MKLKQFAVVAFATVVGFGMVVQDAEAKRLGGGRSFGMSRDAGTMKQATPSKPVAPTQNAAPTSAPAATVAAVPPKPASAMSRWMGPIAGLAAGLGIAALMSHLGMGEGMGNFLMIALLVMAVVFVVRMFMAKRAAPSTLQYAGAGNMEPQRGDTTVSRFETPIVGAGNTAATVAETPASAVPADFDIEGFVRQAKLNFMRLQAANDRGDMDDIKEFTAPEMFAEIQMQYQERGKSAQQTDVLELNAHLIDVVTEATRHVASVRFSGQLRESPNAAPEAFDEVWHLAKPTDGTRGWLVAGIQQL